MVQLDEITVTDKHTVFGYFNFLKNSIEEEGKNCDLLMPFLNDIQDALEVEDYPKILHLLDELEEFMDLKIS
jgi:hypothetical protein